jgi:Holliday junction resolvase RusA-like endonuclease
MKRDATPISDYRSLKPTFDDQPRALSLRLPLPPRLNERYSANRHTGGLYISKKARAQEAGLLDAVIKQVGRLEAPMLRGALSVHYTITPRDRRLPDIDAFEKSLLDIMTEAKVWADDKQVASLSKARLAPCPADPHILIEISETGLSFDDGCLFLPVDNPKGPGRMKPQADTTDEEPLP